MRITRRRYRVLRALAQAHEDSEPGRLPLYSICQKSFLYSLAAWRVLRDLRREGWVELSPGWISNYALTESGCAAYEHAVLGRDIEINRRKMNGH
jgi:DNA-binding IclR family transcriptional regulator